MREFAEAFLLVFAQLSVGGLFTLSIPPFQQIERGFYKSTAGIYLGAASLAVAGWTYLLVTRGMPSGKLPFRVLEVSLWAAFCVAFGVYLYSLWGDPYRLRARSYLAALALGLGALAATALRYAPGGPVAALVYPLGFAVSAVLLGTASTGMLLGHWYLIDVGMTLTPFRSIHRAFVNSIHVQVATLVGSAVLLWFFAAPATQDSLRRLFVSHELLLGLRMGLGPVAAYALAWMIGRTLAVPQTMAATGLFYIAVLAVMVGEILGRTILFRTALPL